MSLVFSDRAAAVVFWVTFAAFVALDARLVLRAIAGRVATLHARQDVTSPPTTVARWIFIGEGLGFAAASVGATLLAWRWPLFVIGIVLAWSGIAVRYWAKKTLGRFFVGAIVIQQGHHLVDGGPYAWVRHPGYAGTLVSLLGLGVASGDLLAATLMFVVPLVAVVKVIHAEERTLCEGLGPAYTDYREGTARLLPGVY